MKKQPQQSADSNPPEQRASDSQREFESTSTLEENPIDAQPAVDQFSGENAFQQGNDVGYYVGNPCSDAEKYYLLKNRWISAEEYKFPASGPRNLKFQRNWLFEFPWLAYSVKLNGVFCQSCVLFATNEVGKGSHAVPKSLVTQPFTRWKDAKEVYRNHQGLVYHKNSIVSAEHFINIHEKKSVNIALQLDNRRKIQVQQNRKMFSSIVETIFARRSN